jgi:hypothetical protein
MPKISNLPAAASAIVTDLIPAVQGGVTKKETLQQVLNLFSGTITITEAQVTGLVADLASKFAIANNLSEGNAATMRTNLGLVIGTNVQAFNANLQSISALGTAANKMIYTTGVATWAEADLTAFARTLLDDANATAAQTTLGLIIGTNVQAWDAGLDSLAALAGTGFVVQTAATTFANRSITNTDGMLDITNGDGVAGNTVINFNNDVDAVEKNFIIGGNFDTNPWQRGTSFTAVADNTYTADRFIYRFNTTSVVNILKTADAPTVAEAGLFTQNCFHIDVTTADAAIAAADQCRLMYRMEGYDFAQLAQRTFTLSFWHKHTKTGTHTVTFSNNGGDRAWVAEYTQAVSDTWEKATITITASPSAGTWDYTNGLGIQLTFWLATGSNFFDTTGSWITPATTTPGSANQVNNLDNTANNFKIALVQLEAGSTATNFEIEEFSVTLLKAQRYYEKTFPFLTAPAQATGSALGAITYRPATAGVSAFGWDWQFRVRKRIPPTMTGYSIGAATSAWWNVTDGAASGASTFVNIGDVRTYATNAQAAGDAIGENLALHSTADAEL